MSRRTANAVISLWIVSVAGCSASTAPAAPPTPSEARHHAAPAPTQDAVTNEEIDDAGEVRAKRLEAALLGRPAPAPELHRLDGGSIELRDTIGRKPVYLKFWATWCVPCREQMPHFESVQQRYGQDITVVAVNVGLNETHEAVRAFRDEYGLSMPIAYDEDGSIASTFQVEVTPLHILIDASGTIAYMGHRATDELDSVLEAMSSGDAQAPSPSPETATIAREPDALALDLLDGGSFQVGAPSKQPTVLSFVATWCDWYLADSRPAMSKACVAQQEQLNELSATLGSRVRVIGVAQSLWTDEEQLRQYQTRYAVPFPLGLDVGGRWFSHFDVRDFPTTVVLNEDGSERLRISGAPADLQPQLTGVLEPRD